MATRTPIKAIRAKCVDCTAGQLIEIRLCPIKTCPLYEYRMGHRPKKDKNEISREVDDGKGFHI